MTLRKSLTNWCRFGPVIIDLLESKRLMIGDKVVGMVRLKGRCVSTGANGSSEERSKVS